MQNALPPRAEIEAALIGAQAWPGLARSPQLAKFLRYIVETRLDGNESGIKAYSIAVDVFGRPATFDPQSDPIVRVQARRLRAALEEYYAGDGASEPLQFYLPVGRYIPEFVVSGANDAPVADESPALPEGNPAPAARPERPILAQIDDIVLIVLLVGVALGIALVLTQVLAPRPLRLNVPQPPRVAVSEFTSVASGAGPGATVAGLAVELVTDLEQFPFIDAFYRPRLEAGSTNAEAISFELSGIARTENGEVQTTASLRRAGADAAIWSMTQAIPSAQLVDSIDDLSRGFSDQLGAISSPLHVEAVSWLEANTDIAGNETDYLCATLFALYRSAGDDPLGQRARDCAAGLMRSSPLSAVALALGGSLQVQQILQQTPLAPDPEPLAEAERRLREALRLLPTSSLVWREYAYYLSAVGRISEAEAAYKSALQLNPADLDALAGYGRMLSLRGPSPNGSEMANQALNRSPDPPRWYREAPAVNALRSGDDILALQHAEALARSDTEMGSVIATVAAHRLGREDVLNRSIAQLVEASRFRRFGIMPVLRQRLPDEGLRTTIAEELAAAGIDPVALNGPY